MSRVLRMDRGLAMGRCLADVLSLRGLKRRECASCAACEGGGHIWSAAEREGHPGSTPCSAVESLRRDGVDAEVGQETGPKQGQWAHHATRTRLVLDLVMIVCYCRIELTRSLSFRSGHNVAVSSVTSDFINLPTTFSNLSCMRFMVAGESDGDAGGDLSYHSGEHDLTAR